MLLSNIPSSSMKATWLPCRLYYFCDFHHTHEKEKNNQYFFPAFLLLIPSGILLFKNDFKLSFEFFFSQHHFGISIILNIALLRVEDIVVWLEWCRFSSAKARKIAWLCLWAPFKCQCTGMGDTKTPFQRTRYPAMGSVSISGAAAAAKNNVSTDYALSEAARIWWVRLEYKNQALSQDTGHSDG